MKTLLDVALSLADRGDAPAVRAFGRDDERRLGYGDLSAHCRRFAARLHRDGVARADRVAIFARPSPEFIAACLGVFANGSVLVPLDTQVSDEVLEHVMTECAPRAVITTKDYTERIQACCGAETGRYVLDAAEGDAEAWLGGADDGEPDEPPSVRDDAVACMFYTSGTTGLPKGVPLSHRNVMFQLESIHAMGLVSGDARVLLPLPLHHVYPFVIGMLTPLRLGLELVLPAGLTGPQLLRATREGRVTHLIGVPRLYEALFTGLRTRIGGRAWPLRVLLRGGLALSRAIRRTTGLRAGRWLVAPVRRKVGPAIAVAASGGAPLNPDLAWDIEGLGWQVAIGYGLTETSPLVTINPPGRARIGSVGKVIEGMDLRIADAPDVSEPFGEVQVRGPSVFEAYYQRDEVTRESFTEEGWFRTGDIGRVDDDGYLYLAGRLSTLIVTAGGENVQPETLEDTYAQHEYIEEIGVLQRGRDLVAVVVPDREALGGGDAEFVRDAIHEAIRERSEALPSYQRLSDFVVSGESLARTRLGKIQRHLLAERYDDLRNAEGDDGRATTGAISIEEMSDRDRELLEQREARRVWDWLVERYERTRLTPDTSLRMDLDVDSLEWVEMTEHIRENSGVELREQETAAIDTVRDLLHAVTASADAAEAVTDTEGVFADPDAFLTERQRRWLEHPPWGAGAVARALYPVNRALMRSAFRLEIHRRGALPEEGPCIVCPNHASYLDPLPVCAALSYARLRTTHWVGWSGAVVENPLFRFFARIGQTVPVEGERAAQSSLAAGAAVLRRGRALVWFPEGHRTPDGSLQTFRPGVGLLAKHFDVPLAPVYIRGAYEAWPQDRLLPRLRKLDITLGEPVMPSTLLAERDEGEAHERIARGLRDRVAMLAGVDGDPPRGD